MAVRVRDLLHGRLGELRWEPTSKWLRAELDGEPVADTDNARLVWEPRRVVPTYAVPEEDVLAALEPATTADPGAAHDTGLRLPSVSERPVLDPSIPFAVHSTAGTSFDVTAGTASAAGAAFGPDDPDLAGYVVLDFDAFDWREEDEPVVSHPRDPFHRIDVLASSRTVRIELEGTVIAESDRALFVYESLLPTRYYLPRDDVRAELSLHDLTTYCAYKGRAEYLSVEVPGGDAVAWTYPDPLADATRLRDLVAFFDERLDVVLDGERLPRPITPWSR